LKKISWQIYFGVFLVVLSTIIYLINYLIFNDVAQIFLYLLTDIAFVPIEVLIVTLILHRVLAQREKANMLKKLNMVIGAFFSEVGVHLLKKMVVADVDTQKIRDKLLISADWQDSDFKDAANTIYNFNHTLDIQPEQIEDFKEFLLGKRNFMLRLLENPNLLEHETFTELLWAVFHLTDELGARKKISKEYENDYCHMIIDLQRVYRLLTLEWIAYMHHLKNDYPYLYSFAIRTNPFKAKNTVEIK
jgi:hypothetical protein